ncbi:MAG: GTPase Era [Gemmatimonadetes bacterium]|nr:GTPase Era [Gemmatimonadota bacterium]
MTESTYPVTSGSFRAGMCAIIGLPNVGKSTLLNHLIGERLSIVTHKAQTTRQRLLGIYTDENHQAIFVDTPGLLEPRYALHESMQAEVARARTDADVLMYVVDLGWKTSLEHARDFETPPGIPSILCLNKADRVGEDESTRIRDSLTEGAHWHMTITTVASTARGVDELREAILGLLPSSPPLYPVDDIAAAPVRFFAAELIRETCFEELADEVPYATAVEIETFREADDPVYIAAMIYIERESQKGIVIGRGGSMIKSIGRKARGKIERLIERPVYLDLRVKVMPNWRRRPGRLKLLGYDLPPGPR